MKLRLILFLVFFASTGTTQAEILPWQVRIDYDGLQVDGLWKVVAAWTDGKRTHFDDEKSGYFRISREEVLQQGKKVLIRRKIEFGRVVAGKFQRTRTPIGFSLNRPMFTHPEFTANIDDTPPNYRSFTLPLLAERRPRFEDFEYVEEQRSTLGLFLQDGYTLVLCGHASHKQRKVSRPKNPAREGKPGDGLAITVLKFVKR